MVLLSWAVDALAASSAGACASRGMLNLTSLQLSRCMPLCLGTMQKTSRALQATNVARQPHAILDFPSRAVSAFPIVASVERGKKNGGQSVDLAGLGPEISGGTLG